MKPLRILHFAKVTPRKCGLYETTYDMVKAERALGLDSFIVDPTVDIEDRDVPVADPHTLESCDVVVSHSGLPSSVEHDPKGKPIIHVLHGRPKSSFLLDDNDSLHVYQHMAYAKHAKHYRYFVTLWEPHLHLWKLVLPIAKLRYVQSPVDLEYWCPPEADEKIDHGFCGQGGSYNVVCADPARIDSDPYFVVHAFYQFALKNPGAKLHLYGVGKSVESTAWKLLLLALKNADMLGEVCAWSEKAREMYRAADLVITPHNIATRTVREALACGTPVVAGSLCHAAPYKAESEDTLSYAAAIQEAYDAQQREVSPKTYRNRAVTFFDPAVTAASMKLLYEEVADGDDGCNAGSDQEPAD